MFGILLLSHNGLAESMLSTAKMIYSAADQDVATIGLQANEKIEDFDRRLSETLKSCNTDDGVVVLVDLLGGTPCNRLAAIANQKTAIITGMNLGMFLELLMARDANHLNIDQLIEASKNSIVNYNTHLENIHLDEIL